MYPTLYIFQGLPTAFATFRITMSVAKTIKTNISPRYCAKCVTLFYLIHWGRKMRKQIVRCNLIWFESYCFCVEPNPRLYDSEPLFLTLPCVPQTSQYSTFRNLLCTLSKWIRPDSSMYFAVTYSFLSALVFMQFPLVKCVLCHLAKYSSSSMAWVTCLVTPSFPPQMHTSDLRCLHIPIGPSVDTNVIISQ